jgi:hypothetical protein
VALELAKSKKPFSDGSLVKKYAIEISKAFGGSGMAEKFKLYPCLIKQWREK